MTTIDAVCRQHPERPATHRRDPFGEETEADVLMCQECSRNFARFTALAKQLNMQRIRIDEEQISGPVNKSDLEAYLKVLRALNATGINTPDISNNTVALSYGLYSKKYVYDAEFIRIALDRLGGK